MNLKLSQAEQEQYRRDGFIFPVRILDAAETANHRRRLEEIETKYGPMHYRHKPYLLMKSASEIARNPALLDAIEDLLGPDILLWDGAYVIKEPHNTKYISWHQDLTYWGLDGEELVTAWVALSPSTPESGCMKMLPGSHLDGENPHHDTYGKNNILHRGQELEMEVDEDKAVNIELQPGEASLHHGWVAHASHPNKSDDRRIGLSLQYLTPRMKQKKTERESVLPVRGQDRFNHFLREQVCTNDFDPAMVTYQAESEILKHEVYDTD